jgi:hypothetical protein
MIKVKSISFTNSCIIYEISLCWKNLQFQNLNSDSCHMIIKTNSVSCMIYHFLKYRSEYVDMYLSF